MRRARSYRGFLLGALLVGLALPAARPPALAAPPSGDRPAVEVDLSTLALCPDDRLVLCCDGLWEMIRNEGIEDVLLRESDPQMACEIMVEQANRAGGSDNISVLIVQL